MDHLISIISIIYLAYKLYHMTIIWLKYWLAGCYFVIKKAKYQNIVIKYKQNHLLLAIFYKKNTAFSNYIFI